MNSAVQLRGKDETVMSEFQGFLFSDVISDFNLLTLKNYRVTFNDKILKGDT